MVSPEILRKFPFFGFLTQALLEKVAMIAAEITVNQGDNLFEAGQPADALYLLLKGSVELCTESYDRYYKPELRRSYMVGEINPGEVLGVSAMISPHILNASAQATSDCDLLRLDAVRLRALMEADETMAVGLMTRVSEALSERLNYTRILLAAARP